MIFHRDAEGPQEDSSMAWSLEAEIPRHEEEWLARRLSLSRSKGFTHGGRVSKGAAGVAS